MRDDNEFNAPMTEHAHWERITDLESAYSTPSGRNYIVSVEGHPHEDGAWSGRLLFIGRGDVRMTEEVTQPSRDALIYWASSLDGSSLDGAFGRATTSSIEHEASSEAPA